MDLGFYIWIRKQRIRLLDIDAPESRAIQGSRSRGFGILEEPGRRKDVIIRTVKGKNGADRETRWPVAGTVYLDGVDVNEEMIRAGYAVPYEDR